MKKSLKKDRCIKFIEKFCGRNVFVSYSLLHLGIFTNSRISFHNNVRNNRWYISKLTNYTVYGIDFDIAILREIAKSVITKIIS